MRSAVVVHVPMHRELRPIDELSAVHPDVVALRLARVAIVRVDRVDAGERDVAALAGRGAGLPRREAEADRRRIAVQRPALQDGQSEQVDFAATRQLHDLLTDAARLALRWHAEQRSELLQLLECGAERRRRLGLRQRCDAARDGVETAGVGDVERELHAAVRAEHVDRDREVRALDVLEQQRLAAESVMQGIEVLREAARACARREPHTIDDRGDLEDRRHGSAHASELAIAIESLDEVSEVRVPAHDARKVANWGQSR
jgi:hypothetical protein